MIKMKDYMKVKVSVTHRVRLFVAPWTVAHQVPLYMGLLSKNTGVGCHFLLWESSQPRDQTWVSYIAGRPLLSEPPGKPLYLFFKVFPGNISSEKYFLT